MTRHHFRILCALFSASLLYACGARTSVPALTQPGLSSPIDSPVEPQSTVTQNIYVAEGGSQSGAGQILVFPTTAKGNVAPRTIVMPEPSGGYNKPSVVAVGKHGGIFVGNGGIGGNSDILVYTPRATSTAPPAETINGADTKIDRPYGLLVDGSGDIYAANSVDSSITVYRPGANGDAAPVRTIGGSKTQMNFPAGMVFNAAGQIVVALYNSGKILAFPRGAAGNVAPAWRIGGNKTRLMAPISVALDKKGDLYVADQKAVAVFVYAAGARGNVAPIRTISGLKTKIDSVHAVSLDAAGNIYVLASGLLVFAPNAHGNVAPVRIIDGSKTQLGVNINMRVH